LFSRIEARLLKLETANRFTAPVVPALGSTPTITGLASGDPSNPRVGDIWLNTTSNTPKYVDSTGAVSTFGGGGSSVITGNVNRPLTGYYYTPYIYSSVDVSYSFSPLNTTLAIPFMTSTTKTAVKIGVYVVVASAGGVARLGIYSNSATEDYPGNLLLDAGTISHATTGFKEITISQTLTAGTLYWLTILSTTGNANCLGAGDFNNTPFMPVSTSGGSYTQYRQNSTTSFPSTFTATKDPIGLAPLIFLGF